MGAAVGRDPYMETVTYTGQGYDVTLTVREASLRDDLKRQAYLRQAPEMGQDEPFADYCYRRPIWAALLACTTIESRGERTLREPTSDEFLDLPSALVTLWVDAAAKANPHWFPWFAPLGEAPEPDVSA